MRKEFEVIGLDEVNGEYYSLFATHRLEKAIDVAKQNNVLDVASKPHNPKTGGKLISFKVVDRDNWNMVFYE